MHKKTDATHKRTTKYKKKNNHTISTEKIEELRSLFFIGGITSYAASKEVGVKPETAKAYFIKFAEKLVEDEDHIPWATREKMARSRYLENITRRIISVRSRLTYYENKLALITHVKDEDGNIKPNYNPDESKMEKYDRFVRNTEIQLNELMQEYTITDSMIPTEILLKTEIEKMLNEK